MTEKELADTLQRMRLNAPINDKVTAIHLFGIRYAKELSSPEISIPTVARLAGAHNYPSEIYKGIRLAQYVDLNDHGVRASC